LLIQNLIEARDRMIEADNKASAASRKMKIADFIKLVTTVLLPNPLPGLANYLLWNRLIGRGTANCPKIFI